jgi:NADH dehydrogenase (ubiquinone) flavoprotein 1
MRHDPHKLVIFFNFDI